MPQSLRCISFDSYIKPQQNTPFLHRFPVVYLLIPTSNHNLLLISLQKMLVVYLLIPTSNHNYSTKKTAHSLLYIF